jgi:hypothetical protein
VRRACLLLILAGCGRDPEAAAAPAPAGPTAPAELPFATLLGAFEYVEGMKLPADVVAWNGKSVKATGFINPGSKVRGMNHFFLVKDRASCCFGTQPKLNHYIDVVLKGGKTLDYSPDPVTVRGTLKVEERRDGDWLLGLYWIEDAELVK